MRNYLVGFQETLKELMFDKSINIMQLSENVSLDRKAVSHWLKGRFYPSANSAIKIANYFKCSVDYLFGLTDTMTFTPKNASDFLTRYKELLNNSPLNDNKVAKLCNIGNSAIAKWRKGERVPNMETLIELSKIFNCSLEFLLGRC